jgi:hypothetical protein
MGLIGLMGLIRTDGPHCLLVPWAREPGPAASANNASKTRIKGENNLLDRIV